jgi:anti-sigma-K factor RskA
MIPVKHIDPEDLPLYAMQLLPPEEMEEMTSQLQHSPEGRKVLAEIYRDLAALAHTAEMHEPPATARQRLMKHVAKEKKAVPANPLDKYVVPVDQYAPRVPAISLFEEEPEPRSFVERALPWTGWLIAAGVSIVAALSYQQNMQLKETVAEIKTQDAKAVAAADEATEAMSALRDPEAVHATLTLSSLDARPLPSGRVTYVASKGSLLFVASNLAPLDPYKTYELWVIPVDGQPVPAGTFKPDERGFASVVLPELPKGLAAKAFGVTIEDAGGSLTPTAPVILKGAAG